MKVILTLGEIYAIESVSTDLIAQLAAVIPTFKSGEQESMLVQLLDAQKRAPELVSVDILAGTATITLPEELIVESTKIIGVFYAEIVELIPVVMVLERMLKKALKGYESSVNALGKKFKKLVKTSD